MIESQSPVKQDNTGRNLSIAFGVVSGVCGVLLAVYAVYRCKSPKDEEEEEDDVMKDNSIVSDVMILVMDEEDTELDSMAHKWIQSSASQTFLL